MCLQESNWKGFVYLCLYRDQFKESGGIFAYQGQVSKFSQDDLSSLSDNTAPSTVIQSQQIYLHGQEIIMGNLYQELQYKVTFTHIISNFTVQIRSRTLTLSRLVDFSWLTPLIIQDLFL